MDRMDVADYWLVAYREAGHGVGSEIRFASASVKDYPGTCGRIC